MLVGGMVTVQNGHFTMHTGDQVQWYFDFEKDKFDHTNRNTMGCRLPPRPVAGTLKRNEKREAYMDERLYGSKATLGKGSYKNSKSVARIKSYQMHKVNAIPADMRLRISIGMPNFEMPNLDSVNFCTTRVRPWYRS